MPDTSFTPIELRDLIAERFDWAGWDVLIEQNGYTIDRPYRSAHPDFPSIIYPLDYGFINGTLGTDGQEIDLFVGSAIGGLVGLLLTADHRRGDREAKLLYRCTPEEIYLANGFINFDRSLMQGTLLLRHPLRDLWEQ